MKIFSLSISRKIRSWKYQSWYSYRATQFIEHLKCHIFRRFIKKTLYYSEKFLYSNEDVAHRHNVSMNCVQHLSAENGLSRRKKRCLIYWKTNIKWYNINTKILIDVFPSGTKILWSGNFTVFFYKKTRLYDAATS